MNTILLGIMAVLAILGFLCLWKAKWKTVGEQIRVAWRARMAWRFVTLAMLAVLGLALTTGCNTLKRGVDLVDTGAGAALAVKDDVIGAVRTIIKSAEQIGDAFKKTNAPPATVAASQ